MRLLSILFIATLIALAFTNPSEAAFSNYMGEKAGLARMLSQKAATLFSSAVNSTGVHRDNYIVCSRYYVGGDGILPRTDLAWGIAGKFFDIEEKDAPPPGVRF